MTDDDAIDGGFAPPPFKPAEALVQLKRKIRETRGLAERGSGFDWKGAPAIQLQAAEAVIQARIAKRPMRTPEWEARTLASAADVRKFGDLVVQRTARWRDADE